MSFRQLSDRVRVADLRAEQRDPAPRTRRRRGKTVHRLAHQVDTLVLHQTAVEFGVSARQIRAAGGDRDLALARRALRVASHSVAFRSGIFAIGHPLSSYVWNANRLNPRIISLEVEGLYPGLMDDPETTPREDILTTWRGRRASELTDLTIETARLGGQELVRMAREENGFDIRWLVAHRQSSPSRRADPGEGIWRAVAPWLAQECGLTIAGWYTIGRGRPIPEDWGGQAGVPY